MDGVAGSRHDGVEAVVVVGGVRDGADGTVGFHQRVGTLDDVAVADFGLGLLVAGVAVGYAVFELVLRISLEKESLSNFGRSQHLDG